MIPFNLYSCLGFFSVVTKCPLQKQVKEERSHNLRLQATWQGSNSGWSLVALLTSHLQFREERNEFIHGSDQLPFSILDGPGSGNDPPHS